MKGEILEEKNQVIKAEEVRPSFTEMVEIKRKPFGEPKLGTNIETLASDDSESEFELGKLKYTESKAAHFTRVSIGSLFILWGLGSIWIPFPTFSSVSILLGLITIPDNWRRNFIKLIKKIPFIGKKVCPFLERLEENIEDTEVSFFKLFRSRD